jgi:DNA-binding PadR family transcriptional regulator
MITPTELDYCVLAVIGRNGPLSTYAVRQHFAGSITRAWSSSTGSIYPAIKRLAAAGMVRATETKDQRGTRMIAITATGKQAIHKWLLSVGPAEGSATSDPIRTRAQFLDELGAGEQMQFFERSIKATNAAIDRFKEKLATVDRDERDPDRIGGKGAIAELKARLQWLTDTRDTLKRSGSPMRSR